MFSQLNRNIETVNGRIIIISNTLPAAGTTKTVSYPDGFTSSNSVIANVNFYNSTLGWMRLPGDYTSYAEVGLIGSGIRLKTIAAGLAGANIKIMLTKT